MSESITIRDVPKRTAEELAARTALSGRSLQDYLRDHLIGLASQPDTEMLIARMYARKESAGSRLASDSVLTHRDADRR